MPVLVSNIQVDLNAKEKTLEKEIKKLLDLPKDQELRFRVQRRSLDARRRKIAHFVYQVLVDLDFDKRWQGHPQIQEVEEEQPWRIRRRKLKGHRPIIVGAGPAGFFAAYVLGQAGLRPLILERGATIAERAEDVERFRREGILNPESNIQFGEGGAGTFSDGKLLSRIKDSMAAKVLDLFVRFGAPEEILWQQKPHIGTDLLRGVMTAMREDLESKGCEFRFHSKVEELVLEERGNSQCLMGLIVNGERIDADRVILAPGHSARDLFHSLWKSSVKLEAKPFAMGFRIEHLQSDIDASRYGSLKGHPALGAAEYQLSVQAGERSVFSFCMCPGGEVVAAASEEGGLVCNGMSYHARDLQNANSAILCNVPAIGTSEDPLAAVRLQREIEQRAFELGGSNYHAPISTVRDYLKDLSQRYPEEKESLAELSKVFNNSENALGIEPSYIPGVKRADLSGLYPKEISLAIAHGIAKMAGRMRAFANPEAILTGVETRSSSPVRILRDPKTYESVNVQGLFPTGEGAGYAGGITSSAVDGIRVAEALCQGYELEDSE